MTVKTSDDILAEMATEFEGGFSGAGPLTRAAIERGREIIAARRPVLLTPDEARTTFLAAFDGKRAETTDPYIMAQAGHSAVLDADRASVRAVLLHRIENRNARTLDVIEKAEEARIVAIINDLLGDTGKKE